jgi:magnesium-transporting ATPase (P-type)
LDRPWAYGPIEKAGLVSWHALPVEEVSARLSAGSGGLAEAEAQRRLATYGSNRLPARRTRGPLSRFLAQFDNLLIILLLAAAGVAVLLGHWLDAQVILLVVLVNAVLGFVQEGRAEKALDAIRELLSPQASVIRDGRRLGIPAESLVPGDLCLTEAGDRVPADLRLVRANTLQIDEAMLTGEAVPTEKAVEPTDVGVPLGDRTSMAFSGTLVTSVRAPASSSALEPEPRSARSARCSARSRNSPLRSCAKWRSSPAG